MTTGSRIITPPMVGVPFLVSRWDAGPSSRMGWPSRCLDFNQRMMAGPVKKLMSSAVIAAPPLRNVRYLKRLNRPNWWASG